MDGSRFDQLTRTLAAHRTRRGLLGSVAGLVAGLYGAGRAGAVTCPPGQYAGAGNRCLCRTTGRPPVASACPCGAGQTDCGGVCKDLSSDIANCGACGHACPPAASVGACAGAPLCRAGTCQYPPLPAGTPCRASTGSCDAAEACDGESTACPPDLNAPNGTRCDDGDPCTVDDVCTDGVCAGTAKVCDPPQACQEPGVCNPQTGNCDYLPAANGADCGADGEQVCCGGACCGAGEECVGNTCQATCLALAEPCADAGACCQDEPTLCQDALCTAESNCCHPAQGSCATACDCCGDSLCLDNHCCSPLFNGCDMDADCCAPVAGGTGGDSAACVAGACCLTEGSGCTSGSDCCSGFCGLDHRCVAHCGTEGEACCNPIRPCESGLNCNAEGVCEAPVCLALQQHCESADQCCQGEPTLCGDSFCSSVPPPPICCRPLSGSCGGNCDCCGSAICTNGHCCTGLGLPCGTDGDCCQTPEGVACVAGACCSLTGSFCIDDSHCCSGLHCNAEGVCEAAVCLSLTDACSSADECCQDEPTFCQVTGVIDSQPRCCRPLSGDCFISPECCGSGVCVHDHCCQNLGGSCATAGDCCASEFEGGGVLPACVSGTCCGVVGSYCNAGNGCCSGVCGADERCVAQ